MQNYSVPYLPSSTIVPENEDLFIPYFNRTYEDISLMVNNKDNIFYPMTITSTATNVLGLPVFGAFIACISGTDSTLPTITASLCKADGTAAGSVAILGSQSGTGAWAGNTLTITSTATHFQVNHNRTGVNGSFNLRIIGTQQ